MVLEFLNLLSNKTRSVYRSVIRAFLTRVYGSFLEENDHELEAQAKRYLEDSRSYQDDINNFVEHEKEKSNAYTIRIQLSVIRTFFMENDIELPQKFWRGLNKRIKGTRAVTQDKIPTPSELRSILGYMSKWGRAYFLMLATSGMRPSEALQLKLNDIELNNNPPKILLRAEYTKTGNSRFTFISSEAKDALEEWLKEREIWIKSDSIGPNDSIIFPFKYVDIYHLWRQATKENGLRQTDPQSGHQLLHPYVLRKFFRTNLGTVSSIIPVDVIEALMGHEQYLRDVYKKYTDDQIAELYLKAEHTLSIFSNEMRIKMDGKLDKLIAENQDFQRRFAETDRLLEEVMQNLEQLKVPARA
jgi:integrase